MRLREPWKLLPPLKGEHLNGRGQVSAEGNLVENIQFKDTHHLLDKQQEENGWLAMGVASHVPTQVGY